MRGFKLILWGIGLGVLALPPALYLHRTFPEGWASFTAMLGMPGLVLTSLLKWPFLLVAFVTAFILVMLLLVVPLSFIDKRLRPACYTPAYVSPAEEIVQLLTVQEDILGAGAEMAKHLGSLKSVNENGFSEEDHNDFYNDVAQWQEYVPITVLHLKELNKTLWEERFKSILVQPIQTHPFTWRSQLAAIGAVVGICVLLGIPFAGSLLFTAHLAGTTPKEAAVHLGYTFILLILIGWLLSRVSGFRKPIGDTEKPDGALEAADRLVAEFDGGVVAQFTQGPALIAYKEIRDKQMLRVSEIIVIALVKQGERA